jgi:hypothetical protein
VDRDGAVRIDARCHGNERVLTWARTGPRGPTGPEGPLGPSDGYFSTRISPGVVSLKLPPGDCIATGGCTAGLTRTASQSTTVPVFGDALSARGTDRFALTPGLGQGGVTYETASSVPNMGESPPPPTDPISKLASRAVPRLARFTFRKGGRSTSFARLIRGVMHTREASSP